MVTAAQVKAYLKPLLEQNKDLALVGRLLVVKPVRHVLRGVNIDRRSSAETIVPTWFIHHTFAPRASYSLAWSDELWGRAWRTTDPDISDALCAEIGSVALPMLRPIQTLEDFIAAIIDNWQGHHLVNDDWIRIAVELARGNLETATKLCNDRICNYPNPGPKGAPVWRKTVTGTQELCLLLKAGDVAGAIEMLHEWEHETVKNLKIEHLWQRTPFPIEERLGLV